MSNQTKPPPLIVAVDFDGTCVTHEFPDIGREIGAPKVLRKIVEAGGQLILWTMRSGEYLDAAVNWFKQHDIPLYGIQRNPTQDKWTSSPKCYAQLYIDDAALGCPLKPGAAGERPYVDWEAVEKLLWPPCKLEVTKEWCEKSAEIEGDSEVGAGLIPTKNSNE